MFHPTKTNTKQKEKAQLVLFAWNDLPWDAWLQERPKK